MKKCIVFFICFAASLLFQAAGQASARTEIEIKGLEAHPDIAGYLRSAVVEKHLNSESFSPLALRNDAQNALEARSYYAAQIDTREQEGRMILEIALNGPYTIGAIQITGSKEKPEHGLEKGEPLLAETVLASQNRIKNQILKSGCYYTLSIRHEVRLDHVNKSGDVTFIIHAGPSVSFGETVFEGAEETDRSYLRRFIKYQKGECWRPEKLESTKTALLETGLLSTVEEKLPETVENDQQADVIFILKERAPVSVRLGASYYSDEGPGVSASWSHRNFSGSGEKLTTDLKASALVQNLGVDYTKPYFLADSQSLSLASSIGRTDSDAFEEFSLNSSAGLKRQFSSNWSGSAGIATEITEITDKNDKDSSDTFGLISIPGSLSFDNRDNILDARKGMFARASAEPFIDAFGEAPPFFKSRLTASTYFGLGGGKTAPVLALRGSVGGILGSSTQDIPATKRFYAGGGNSVRGFGYQEAGPFDNGDPAGGRSILETTAEIRFKITDSFGAVTFVDAGNVFNSAMPDFKGGLFVGAGAGIRYYTYFAPIRFDVAVPVNKRNGLDQSFQFYISIGQAF
jgi:translocation and assembly module TamA